MRAWLGVSLLASVLVSSSPAMAQDADALRRELEQMRQQFEAMKARYDNLSERLRNLEAKSPPGPPPAPVPSGQTVSQAPAPPGSQPSLMELARPREPFSLYERRGPGQLLFDMGITGDFIGNLTQRNVQKATGGTFSGRENRFFPREVEINLFGQVDPYARAEVRFEAGEDMPGEATKVDLAEATISFMTLPYGTQAKLGQMRSRFGLTNVIHEHDLPFIDRPNVLVRFLGEGGLTEKGIEATWVPPLPFFLEFLGGVFNGDNETAFGRGSIRFPLVTGRVRTFFDLDEWGAFQLGASVANGQTPEQKNDLLVGFDGKYKYKPDGWEHALFTAAGEYLYAIRQVNVVDPEVGIDQTRTRERNGWYVSSELQPVRFGSFSRWSVGLRYDWTEFPVNPGHEWAVQPYLSFMPSEFLRFRLGYKHTERDHRDGIDLNGGSARIADEALFQATFILGAHPAHPF